MGEEGFSMHTVQQYKLLINYNARQCLSILNSPLIYCTCATVKVNLSMLELTVKSF